MKIYSFKYSCGAVDWVYAPCILEAKKFYLSHTGCGDLDGCNVKSIPKKLWSSYFILDINEIEPSEDESYNEADYHNGYKIQETFAEYAERNTHTDIIATTEF